MFLGKNSDLSYFRKDDSLQYWQSLYGHEVDFIVGSHTAVEVKASKKISKKHLKSLEILKKEKILKTFFIVSRDKISANFNRIKSLHWEEFLKQLWNHQIF